MAFPAWIKLAAASEEELFSEALNIITDLGGIDAAQKLFQEEEEKSKEKVAGINSASKILSLAALLSMLLGVGEAEVIKMCQLDLRKALVDVATPDKKLKNQLVLWIKDPQRRMPGTTYEIKGPEPKHQAIEPPENVAEFVADIRAAAAEVDLDGIPVETLLPLFGHESGWGTGAVYQQTSNPGSISATSPQQEAVPDKYGQGVRVYQDLAEGIQATVNLLHNPRYSKALAAAKATASDGSAEARHVFYDELAAAGYCPQADYAERLKNADKYFYKISQ